MSTEAQMLNDAIFKMLLEEEDGSPRSPEIEAMLEALHSGDISSALVLADYLDERGDRERPEKIRALFTKEGKARLLCGVFRAQMAESLADLAIYGESYVHAAKLFLPSRLAFEQIRETLQLFPWFNMKKAVEATQEFTRAKMKEDGYLRRILPPVPVEE